MLPLLLFLRVKPGLVRENQSVAAGQMLFRIDPAPFRLAVAKAEANAGQVRSEIAGLKASYREKQAEMALARTRYAFALKNQARQADLVAQRVCRILCKRDFGLQLRQTALELDGKAVQCGLPVADGHRPFLADIA